MNNWQKVKLKDFIDFNPTEKLSKGAIAKKISMDTLQPFCRDINKFSLEPFNGGTKFKNNDTIMARITPCLENGKTSQVNILEKEEVAFGSTEYIVLRAKANISSANFIYYLAITPFIRDKAIKSMVGTSGRQRVQTDVVKNIEIPLPPLAEQEKIASILSTLDDKIEVNNKINKNLEEQAQALFKSWFVDFEPFNGTMPSDWKGGVLGDIAKVGSGKRPPMRSAEKNIECNIPIIGASSIMGYTNKILLDKKILIIGRVGTHGIVQRVNSPCWASDNTLVIESLYYEFAYQVLKSIDYNTLNVGAVQPLITQTDLKETACIIPTEKVLTDFENLINTLMTKCESNLQENKKLASIRDSLLPKLLSGEIRV